VLVDGTEASLKKRLKRSKVSRTINTSFVERLHGTDRGRNARKVRRTYCFSKDWQVHEAMTYFTLYRDNFCWCVRTLPKRDGKGQWQQRTPAMAAGLTEHAWTLLEWVTFPAAQHIVGHHLRDEVGSISRHRIRRFMGRMVLNPCHT
jgi:hypothetical protein